MSDELRLIDPAECRRRASQLRERAAASFTAREELTEAAATWDELAEHAASIASAYRQIRRPGDASAK